jgi:hypothetical protein
LADGQWHSVSVDFQLSVITIDHLYKRQMSKRTLDENAQIKEGKAKAQNLYTGNVPSTSYPHQFIGCLRNVHFGGIALKVRFIYLCLLQF